MQTSGMQIYFWTELKCGLVGTEEMKNTNVENTSIIYISNGCRVFWLTHRKTRVSRE